jgi:histidinol-phosphate aminotransferase
MINRRDWIKSAGLAGATALLGGLNRVNGSPFLSGNFDPRAEDTGISKLSSNENPYGPSEAVLEAIRSGFEKACRYPWGYAGKLVSAIAEREGVATNHIVLTGGSVEGLRIAGLLYGMRNGEIVAADPTFLALMSYAEQFGAHIHRVPLDDQMVHDLPAMERKINDKTRLVFICNPNNPTGTLLPAGALRDFCTSVSGKTMVFCDEAYYDYIQEPGYPSMTELVKKGMNVIVSRTFSKVYGMAGLRIGYLIAKPEIAGKLREHAMAGTNILAMEAALKALEDREFYSFSLKKNDEARKFLYSAFDNMKLKYIPSHGNFVFFRTGMSIGDFMSKMEAKGVMVGRPFPPYNDWCRISTGTMENMKHFAGALKEVV